MRRLSPGSTLWLAAHELRLSWRIAAGSRWGRMRITPWLLAAVAIIASAIGLMVAWPIAVTDPAADERIRLLMAQGLSWLIPISAMQALFGAQTTLTAPETGLMLTSPLPLRRLLLARATTLALGVASAWPILLVAVPFVNGLALLGRPAVLMAYPMLIAIAVAVGSVAFALMLGLVAVGGRTIGGIVVGVLAVALLLMLMPGVIALLPADAVAWLAQTQILYAYLTRAMTGDGVAFVVVVAGSVAVASGCAWACEGQFRRIFLQFQASPRNRVRPARAPAAFATGVMAVLWRKELRLLTRRPTWLVGQLGLLAVIALSMREVLISPATGVRGFVFITTVGLGSFARAVVLETVVADGPAELLRSAPLPLGTSRSAKMGASALLVGIAAVGLMGALASLSWRAVPIALSAGILAAGSASWLALREPGPAGWNDPAGTRAALSGTRILTWVANGALAALASSVVSQLRL